MPDRVGPGRVVVLAYGFFTLAAGARSAVQLATRAAEAPVAYGLSAFAAVVYATGTVLLALADRGRSAGAARTARVLCGIEVTGVLVVGVLSLVRPGWFPHASVWSGFGSGYGYVPAVLPLVALLWLHRAAAVVPRSVRDDRSDRPADPLAARAAPAAGDRLRGGPDQPVRR